MPRTATTKTPAKSSTTKTTTTRKPRVSAKVEEVTPAVTKKVGRPRKSPEVVVPEKKTVVSKKTVPAKNKEARFIASDNPNLLNPETDSNKKIAGMTYKALAEQVGVGVGTEQFLAVIELLKGGETRAEINERVKDLLPATTQTGTPKQVTNLVSGVHNRMLARGFKVQGTFKLVPVKASTTK
jgi:hypothetical protein